MSLWVLKGVLKGVGEGVLTGVTKKRVGVLEPICYAVLRPE